MGGRCVSKKNDTGWTALAFVARALKAFLLFSFMLGPFRSAKSHPQSVGSMKESRKTLALGRIYRHIVQPFRRERWTRKSIGLSHSESTGVREFE